MAETTVQTPYSTAMPFIISALPKWTDEYNAQRIASYNLYDDLYDNDPTQYRMMLRSSDEKPIYIPTAKRLINTLARYVGRGWGFMIDPDAGTPAEQEAATTAFGDLFKRERILSQFNSGKKEWMRRGDWIWYITADPAKSEGRRISVKTIDPRLYFPIEDPVDPDRVSGAMLVEEVVVSEGVFGMQVQRWLKPNNPSHPEHNPDPLAEVDPEMPIAYDKTIYEIEGWNDPEEQKVLNTPVPMYLLEGITSLPLYHIKNNETASNPFGRSDLAGLESIISGVNQAISDEDLALAMVGIGMFWTDSGAPVNAAGEAEAWILGPNRVVEVAAGTKFNKLDGITSVQPSQDHVKYLEQQAYGTVGVNEVALGSTDGSTQISGVALAIKMQPIFDAADEKDLVLNDNFNQMFYDLKQWFDVYEGVNLGEAAILSVVSQDERLPFDREARWKELVEGYTNGIFSLEFVIAELINKFGYEIPSNMIGQVQAALDKKAAQADPYGERVAGELEAGDGAEAEVPEAE